MSDDDFDWATAQSITPREAWLSRRSAEARRMGREWKHLFYISFPANRRGNRENYRKAIATMPPKQRKNFVRINNDYLRETFGPLDKSYRALFRLIRIRLVGLNTRPKYL